MDGYEVASVKLAMGGVDSGLYKTVMGGGIV